MPTKWVALTLLLPALAYAAEDAPAWLKAEASAVLPAYGPKVNSVVLLNEEHTVVGESGKLTTTTRTAVRIIASQRVDVKFFEQYDIRSGKVREFNAWMISPSGRVKKYGKDEILDVACAENDVYNECRRRLVSGKRDAEAGATFGYEATVEHQSFTQQLLFPFQDSEPVRLARFQVTLPPAWEIKPVPFNGAPSQPTASGRTYTWQMENLPPLEPEPAAPSFLTSVPWVGVNLIESGGKRAVLSWPEAAKQLYDLNDSDGEAAGPLAEKALAITQGAGTELEKIRTIGRFAQQVNYVSIQVNLAKGGGYRPHPAAQVFQKLYGDCKDKANLTRAMLRAIGITTYPVAIYSGDRTRIAKDWPSLGAFNHAIVAIRVKPETKAAAVLDHPGLGRLLFFDPTDPYVPPGYLPPHEQASLALVGAPEKGDLVTVPAAAAEAGARERQVDAVLGADGSLSGSFVETWSGESLAQALAEYHGSSRDAFLKGIERWVGRSIPGAVTTEIQATENEDRFVLKGKFASARFARLPQPRMVVFRPALLRHAESVRLTGATRRHPVVLDADNLLEKVRIALPQEFKVDELPDSVHLDSPFGKCDLKWVAQPGSIVFERKLELPPQSVPPDRYQDLRRFLDTMNGAPESPVVLLK